MECYLFPVLVPKEQESFHRLSRYKKGDLPTERPPEALIRLIRSIIAKRYVYKDKFLWNDEAD